MRDYPTLHTLRHKKSALVAGSIFHSHSRIFNNEDNSYLDMREKLFHAVEWCILLLQTGATSGNHYRSDAIYWYI